MTTITQMRKRYIKSLPKEAAPVVKDEAYHIRAALYGGDRRAYRDVRLYVRGEIEDNARLVAVGREQAVANLVQATGWDAPRCEALLETILAEARANGTRPFAWQPFQRQYRAPGPNGADKAFPPSLAERSRHDHPAHSTQHTAPGPQPYTYITETGRRFRVRSGAVEHTRIYTDVESGQCYHVAVVYECDGRRLSTMRLVNGRVQKITEWIVDRFANRRCDYHNKRIASVQAALDIVLDANHRIVARLP